MTANGWLQIALFFGCVPALTKPGGIYLPTVYETRTTWLDPIFGPIERLFYRAAGISPDREMRWTEYLAWMLTFSLATLVLIYAVERLLPGVMTDTKGVERPTLTFRGKEAQSGSTPMAVRRDALAATT